MLKYALALWLMLLPEYYALARFFKQNQIHSNIYNKIKFHTYNNIIIK